MVDMNTEDLASLPRRSEIVRDHKAGGERVAAVLPIHYPRALLRAFGYLPMEVWGPPNVDASLGAAHLQGYICSLVRNALSFIQGGGLAAADLILIPHACDSLQGLASILIDFVQPEVPVIPLYLPRGVGPGERAYLAAELRNLSDRLGELSGHTPSEAELMTCVQREEEADQLLSALHQRRMTLPLSNLAFYRLVRSREFLPAEAFCERAQAALASAGSYSREGIPILLSGLLPEPMRVLESISEIGGLVVADDLACGGRRLYPPGESQDAFDRMAQRILGAPPGWASSLADRLAHLKQLVRASGARGVVFYVVKFCEPELIDHPELQKGLQEAGVPTLTVEIDLNDPLSHRTITRLEAFLEMIS